MNTAVKDCMCSETITEQIDVAEAAVENSEKCKNNGDPTCKRCVVTLCDNNTTYSVTDDPGSNPDPKYVRRRDRQIYKWKE
jgi:hypothetical protein